MKNLGIMLIAVMLMAGSASALILFEEDFTGTPGANLTTLNWTTGNTMFINGFTVDTPWLYWPNDLPDPPTPIWENGTPGPMYISGTVIDKGTSATAPGTATGQYGLWYDDGDPETPPLPTEVYAPYASNPWYEAPYVGHNRHYLHTYEVVGPSGTLYTDYYRITAVMQANSDYVAISIPGAPGNVVSQYFHMVLRREGRLRRVLT